MGFGGYDTNVERFKAATPRPPLPHAGAQPVASGEAAQRPLSRQSSLNSIEWGETAWAGGRAVETPPCAPGAFEASGLETPPSRAGRSGCASASDLQALCRAPRQSRQTLVSRSSSQRGGAASAEHTSSSNAISTEPSPPNHLHRAISTDDTLPRPSPFPRRPVWGELANMPAWGDVIASSAAVQAQLVRVGVGLGLVRDRVRVRVSPSPNPSPTLPLTLAAVQAAEECCAGDARRLLPHRSSDRDHGQTQRRLHHRRYNLAWPWPWPWPYPSLAPTLART